MYDLLYRFLTDRGVAKTVADSLAYVLSAVFVILACLAAMFVLRVLVIRIIARSATKTAYRWDDILLETRFFHRLSHLAVPVLLSVFASSFPGYEPLLEKLIRLYFTAVLTAVADAALSSADRIYLGFKLSKTHPLRGVFQVCKAAVYIVGLILGISVLIGENPVVMLGGIGALMAILSLIFKDAILGFVAGIQLTANDMIRIGDRIEMPKYSADGTVLDLSLTTVKVENFDRIITSIPAYALISDAFINWRGMERASARRIKRALYIDASCVRLCDGEMLERFRGIGLIGDYIDGKLQEIDAYNRKPAQTCPSLSTGAD